MVLTFFNEKSIIIVPYKIRRMKERGKMAKKDDPLGLVISIIFGLPILIIGFLMVCVKGIAGLGGSTSRATNNKKYVTTRKHGSNYTKSRTTRSTAATRSAELLSTLPKLNSTPQAKVANSATNTSRLQVSASTTKRISLYEALRLPGDPDPEFGGCSIYVNSNEDFVSSQEEEEVEFDFDNESIDEIEEDFDEVDNVNEMDAAFALAAFDFISNDLYMYENYDNDVDKDEYDDDEYDWETDCEYCEELFEDCECEYRHESHEAIGLWDCGCDDEDDDSRDSSGRNNDRRKGLCDFDKFSSFKGR